MSRVDEIEYMVACNELTAAQVFTQMRQLIPNKNIEAERDALQEAKKACIDIYMDLHVSEMKGKPEHLKQAWSVGNMLYIKKLEGEG